MSTLDWLRAEAEDYTPNATINAQLAKTILIPVVGPIAVGKSTRIQHIVETNLQFGRSVGFTTRQKRDGESDDQYRFTPHTEDTMTSIAKSVEMRQLVQYAVHPNGFIYGSEAEDYAHPYTMLDIVYSAIAPLRKLAVQSMMGVSLVCHPQAWKERFASRISNPEDVKIRLIEGIDSLSWSLGQEDMIWVDNTEPLTPDNDEIVEITQGIREPNPANKQVGIRLRSELQSMLDACIL